MYGYKINRSGLRRMMTSDPQLHRAIHSSARQLLAVARSLAAVDTGELRGSGRVEDLGVRPVASGEPRMTVAVVFHARHAMSEEKRTGFLSGAAARGRKR
jgi:hypothetical protein